jgi:hypothetical protein
MVPLVPRWNRKILLKERTDVFLLVSPFDSRKVCRRAILAVQQRSLSLRDLSDHK